MGQSRENSAGKSIDYETGANLLLDCANNEQIKTTAVCADLDGSKPVRPASFREETLANLQRDFDDKLANLISLLPRHSGRQIVKMLQSDSLLPRQLGLCP